MRHGVVCSNRIDNHDEEAGVETDGSAAGPVVADKKRDDLIMPPFLPIGSLETDQHQRALEDDAQKLAGGVGFSDGC